MPVYENCIIPETSNRTNIAGSWLTTELQKILEETYSCTPSEVEILNDIKRKVCYVALDFDAEMKLYKTSNELVYDYELPDGIYSYIL